MIKFFRIGVLLFVSALSAACSVGVSKVEDLKTAEGVQKESVLVDQNYQTVFQTIVQSGELPAIEGKSFLNTDRQEGRIWIQAPIYGNNSFALIEIRPAGNNQSTTDYFCIAQWRSWCQSIQKMLPAVPINKNK
jgi:hypothetical protein